MTHDSRAIAALTAAKLVSTTGSWTSTVATPWLVLTTTGSPARMSLVLAAQVAGIVLLGLPSGALVSRLGPRRTMLLGDAARAPLIALVPVLYHLQALAFPLLLAVAFTMGGFTASYVAAQRLAIPALVGEDPKRVARANSVVDGATRIGNLAGPALAGVLIGVLGAANVLWFDALTFLISFVIVLTLIPAPSAPSPPAASHPPPASALRGSAAAPFSRRGRWWVPVGVRTMAADQVLRWMAVALLLVGITYPLIMVTLPVLTTDRYGGDSRTYGALVSASGLGLAAGSLLAVWASGRWNLAKLGGLAVIGAMGPLWLLPLPLSKVGTGTVLAVSGLFIPIFSACLTSYFTLRTHSDQRPQVMTSVVATENTAAFAAYAAGGILIAAAGTTTTLLLAATTATGCAVALRLALHYSLTCPSGATSGSATCSAGVISGSVTTTSNASSTGVS